MDLYVVKTGGKLCDWYLHCSCVFTFKNTQTYVNIIDFFEMKNVQYVDVNDRIQIYVAINIDENLFLHKNSKLFLVLLVLSVTELKINVYVNR